MDANQMSQCVTYGPIGMLQLKGAVHKDGGGIYQFKRLNSFVIRHISQSSILERITSIG